MIHNREDPMSAPKYPQTHVGQYMGELNLIVYESIQYKVNQKSNLIPVIQIFLSP